MIDNEKQKILIINNSEEAISVITSSIPSNCKITNADSGEVGLSKAFSENPDMIVLDLNMPGSMSGQEIYEFLQHGDHTKDIAIVLLVDSYDQINDEIHLKGNVDFLTKPLVPKICAPRLKNLLTIVTQRKIIDGHAKIDITTGAANRQNFNAHLEDEWRRCMRSKADLSLVKVNPDHFKLYNDRYGFDKGDLVLRAIANEMRSGLQRPGDMIARFDGANFFVVLPEVGEEGAKFVTEKLRAAIENLKIPHAYTPFDTKILTVSMSGSSIVPNDNTSLSYFIDTASMLLDKARQEGGNTVKWYI